MEKKGKEIQSSLRLRIWKAGMKGECIWGAVSYWFTRTEPTKRTGDALEMDSSFLTGNQILSRPVCILMDTFVPILIAEALQV